MPLIRRTQGDPAPSGDADFEVAFANLSAADPEARWRAARTLSAFPAAARALGGAAALEPDVRVREAMSTSLARIGTAESLTALTQHLRSDDAARRTCAMDAMRVTRGGLGDALAGLLADADPDVRLLACDLARDLPTLEATSLLCAVLDGDVEVNVCAAAVDVLAEVGSSEATASLTRCAARLSDPFLAFAIKVAIERIGAGARVSPKG